MAAAKEEEKEVKFSHEIQNVGKLKEWKGCVGVSVWLVISAMEYLKSTPTNPLKHYLPLAHTHILKNKGVGWEGVEVDLKG